jgi:hypothetical protein
MFPLFSKSALSQCYLVQPNCDPVVECYGGPASHLFILQPGYDPLIEYCALKAGSKACGRTESRPDWEILRGPGDFGRARIRQSVPERNPLVPTLAAPECAQRAAAECQARVTMLKPIPSAVPAGGRAGHPV